MVSKARMLFVEALNSDGMLPFVFLVYGVDGIESE